MTKLFRKIHFSFTIYIYDFLHLTLEINQQKSSKLSFLCLQDIVHCKLSAFGICNNFHLELAMAICRMKNKIFTVHDMKKMLFTT